MSKIIGIDLGSTLSEVAVVEGNSVTIIQNNGKNTTPSVVAFKDGERKTGEAAKRQMLANPDGTVALVKRMMGSTYKDIEPYLDRWSVKVIDDNGYPKIVVEDKEYTPQEISAMILGELKRVAEDYLGEPVTEAVITVPAYFGDSQRKATIEAAEIAGLTVKRIIAEPTAAILSSNIDSEKGGKYMVVDFGGSTLDFSVVDISDNVYEILSSYGDCYCGGSDVDTVLANYVVNEFKKETGVDLSEDSLAMTRVLEAVDTAKKELSDTMMTDINLPYIGVKDNSPVHLSMSISRAQFEQLATPIIDKVVNCGKVALEKAKMNANELDGVLLVGGSCRIPLLQQKLSDTFGVKLIKSSNLDLAVAEGAAKQADILSGNNTSDILLLDVTPLTLGIETMGGVMTPIIEANTTIPCKRSQIFSTAENNQDKVTIHVLQGERASARDNKTIGMFNLDGILPAPKGVPQIEVTFDINADGIITVSAKDKGTDKEQHITIEADSSLSKEEIERMKAEAELHAKEDEAFRKHAADVNKCESAIFQNEQLLDSMKDNEAVTDADKESITKAIDELKAIKDSDNFENLDKKIEEIEKLWQPISAKVYGQQGAANGGQPFNNPFGNNFDFGNFAGFNGAAAPQQPTNANDDVEVQTAQ